MKDENGNTYFKEYWDRPPAQLTEKERAIVGLNGRRRRKSYIAKHPEGKKDLAPSGWDEPMKPKKRRRR